jgi:hypothetical protein
VGPYGHVKNNSYFFVSSSFTRYLLQSCGMIVCGLKGLRLEGSSGTATRAYKEGISVTAETNVGLGIYVAAAGDILTGPWHGSEVAVHAQFNILIPGGVNTTCTVGY